MYIVMSSDMYEVDVIGELGVSVKMGYVCSGGFEENWWSERSEELKDGIEGSLWEMLGVDSLEDVYKMSVEGFVEEVKERKLNNCEECGKCISDCLGWSMFKYVCMVSDKVVLYSEDDYFNRLVEGWVKMGYDMRYNESYIEVVCGRC